MKKDNELFTTMPVGKAVAKLAVPTVISQIVVILYSLADTFFVGQIGDPNQLAALSITFPIFTLLTAVANLFGIGANSVIARNLGKNDVETAKKASALGFWASFVVTAVLAIVLGVFMKPILTFFKADAFTFSHSARYLLWVFVVGGIPTVAGLILGHLVRAVGKTKEAGIGLSIGGIMNITVLSFVLDALFGVTGLMWVQAITDTVSFVIAAVLYARFKKSVVKEAKAAPAAVVETHTTNRIITISREFGSGGRTIAKEVAAKLQIPCYDSEIIEKIATKTGFAKEYIEKYGEYTVTDNLYDNALAGRTYNGQSDADKLWLAQKEVIVNLAKEGSCVIVGRCADYILQDMADCITVFIHASDEYRQNRIVSVYGEREETPVKWLHDKDKKRKAYYELYTGTQWGKADGYQLCLDSEKIGIPKCVDMVCSLYQN